MTIEAYAKTNFTLEVLGERADGFHALRSLVFPVSLRDTLEITFADSFSCDTGYDDDLCLKAARTLARRLGADRVRPGSIHVVKRIPAGGGLGGGSADAAATLIALNEMWNGGLDAAGLAALGAETGSDVPSLVLAHGGDPVLMEGRGEIVTALPDLRRTFHIVLANPGVNSSTAEVYKKCISCVTDGAKIMYNMRQAVASGDLDKVAAAFRNDLAEPAEALHPEIGAARKALLDAGSIGATVSGSGATVFGLAPSEESAGAIAASLRSAGLQACAAQTCCPVV